jgi:hypothetical protein
MTIKDNRNAKYYSRYEYYKILRGSGPAIPVRIVYDDEGLQMGADTIDAKNGVLMKNAGIIGEAEESPYSDYSTEEEFWDLCRQHVEYEKNKAK